MRSPVYPSARHACPNGAFPMIIGPNAVILGYVLKSIPNSDFGMKTFEGRLRLQKIIYMVEAFGVYLGYDFSWYLRGPYCTRLARAGFELEQIMDCIPNDATAQFMRKEAKEKFDRCVAFIRSVMDGPGDLDRIEIAASIHLLAKNASLSKEEIFERVVSKMSKHDSKRIQLEGLCGEMWDKLRRHLLVPDRERGSDFSPRAESGEPGNGYRVTSSPDQLDRIKDAMTDFQQYGDIALAVTMKDLHDNEQELRPNDPPAFMRRPNEVEQLVPDPVKDKLITDVLRQYG